MSHTHTHTYTPTLTHTHSHKPTRKHTPTHTDTYTIYQTTPQIPPISASMRGPPCSGVYTNIYGPCSGLCSVQETSDLYPVLLVLVQHDAEEAQDHRGRRQGRQPLNNISYNIPISGFYMFLLNAFFFSFRFQASMIPSSILCCFLLLLHPKSIPWYVLLGWQEIPIWWVKTLF